MTANGPPTSSDLGKLTVPQLKALCKERRITGYSKLGKAALLQKLAGVAVPLNDRASAISPVEEVQNPVSSNACPASNTANQPTSARGASSTEIRSPVQVPLPLELSKNHTTTSAALTSTQKTSGTKRPAHIDISDTPKRSKTSCKSTVIAGHEPLAQRTPTPQQKLAINSPAFKVPELPTQRKRSLHGNAPTLAIQSFETSRSSTSRQLAGSHGQFKPLRPKPIEADRTLPSVVPKILDTALVSDFQATPLPVLSPISFPPKASERKWVYRWAIILSAIFPADRQTCALVSRTFRYAVYLSAIHILSRNYAGRRLDAVLKDYPRNMTNFWPYLRFRVAEVTERRDAFKRSFLGRPNDEKQVDVAIRFVLTRMWFATSVGAYGHDASTWSQCIIRDVEETVKGEIWQVIAQDNGTGASCSFFVLEATCEVIGRPPSSQGEDTLGYCLRADWTAWIAQGSPSPTGGSRSLRDCVRWSNTEEYHQGISKAWLRRVQSQDGDNMAKRITAERYILACVVANGISGPWMTTSAMAQEFAGLPDRDGLGLKTAGRSTNTVNMFLPAHHHVESVHFTTCKGDALHGGVAVVQTPGREYYVLRDNGMQVGCEEEGIAEVWQQILGCDALGRAC